tara:strand:- start:1061 stop:2425 length:1365 start_codon:yes stop_codon:yes gene_type:complete
MRTGRKGQNSGLWRCFKAPDAAGRSAGSRFRYALRTAGLSGLAAGLLIGLWLIGSWVLGTLQTTGIDLPEIEVLRAREEADYDENGVPIVQEEPFVLLLGPGEEPPLRPLEIAPQIGPAAGALQAVNAEDAAEDAAANGVERVIGPERFKKPARRADGPGDDEPLADGPGDDEPLGDGGGAQVGERGLDRFDRDIVPNERAAAARAGNVPAGENLLDGKWLRMRLQTNYANPGVLVFSSSGTFLTMQTVHPTGRATTPRDPTSGLFNVPVNLNIDWLQAALDDLNLLTPDMGVLTLDVSLHSSTTGARIALGSWSGDVRGLPWMGFSADLPELGNVPALRGGKKGDRPIGLLEAAQRRRQSMRVRAELHPRSGDGFYFLVGSSNRHDLIRAPGENFDFLRNVEVLSSGSLPRISRPIEVFLDSPSARRVAFPYVALWSYDEDLGWARSRVYLVP